MTNDLYRKMINGAPIGIVLSSIDGRILEINQAGCRFLGYERDDLIGSNAIDLYVIPSQREKIVSEVVSKQFNGDISEFVIDLKCKGSICTFSISMVTFGNDNRGALLTVFKEVELNARINRTC